MPWKECGAMDERMRFVVDWERLGIPFSELCDRYGISRPTGYKWVERYASEGALGLADRSRRPCHSPQATAKDVVDAIVEVRRRHPTWGGKKIVRLCEDRLPGRDLPHASTVDDILRRNGLTRMRVRRRRPGHPGRPITRPNGPNDLWTVDFKGEFLMGDGQYCFPLTITDLFSRYLFACKGLLSTSRKGVVPVFDRLFREYGLPDAIRSDNGSPFASCGLARLSKLSVWWIKLGIHPELIEPGCPSQNGAHERMHKTLKAEATRPPRRNLRSQQGRFDEFRQEYNFERPHESLNQETPSAIYEFSGRAYTGKLDRPEYPGHFEVRRVSASHSIRWKHRPINVGSVLIGEYVGLEEVAEGVWGLYFYDYLLGHLNERTGQIEEMPTGMRHEDKSRYHVRGTPKNHTYKRVKSEGECERRSGKALPPEPSAPPAGPCRLKKNQITNL